MLISPKFLFPLLLLPVHFAICIVFSGCSAEHFRQRADSETIAVLFGKTGEVDNVEDDLLAIGNPNSWNDTVLKDAPVEDLEFLGKRAKEEKEARLMTLDVALLTGVTHSRSYLSEKESVFLEALSLTLAQHRLSPIWGAGADITRQSDARNAAAQAGLTDLVATNTFARSQMASFNYLYKTGARLTTAFSQDFLNFMTGRGDVNDSQLAVTLIQPLLRGGGTTATLEALTQADRDVLYSLRGFANFRREFIVDLVGDYYGVLQARDNVVNTYLAYKGFTENLKREEALAEEARRTQTQLGQLKQALLQSESRWLTAIRNYETRLDQFKLTLGIPVEHKILLDDEELKKLKIEDPGISRDQAVKIALVTRPDLVTSRERIEDAERAIKVAENALKGVMDLRVDYDVISNSGDRTPDINFDRRNISTNLDMDLPLDRKAERNTYRAALITKDVRERQYEGDLDEVRLQIYEDWRALELAVSNYEIAVQGIELAERRLEEQRLLFELGKGEARDLVDAQNDLVNAQNQRTSTLIDHTLARLRLWRDLGILYINNDGSWIEKLEQESKVAPRVEVEPVIDPNP